MLARVTTGKTSIGKCAIIHFLVSLFVSHHLSQNLKLIMIIGVLSPIVYCLTRLQCYCIGC